MAGMFDDLVPGGSKPKAEQKTESGPWDAYKPQGQNEDGPWSVYQGGAFDDLVPATKPKRNIFARANDTVIEAGNAAAGLAKAGIDLFAPDSGASESIGQFIQSGQDKQSDWKKDQRQRLNSELTNADGELDKAGIYARHALIEDPLGTAGQIAGNIGPFGIAGKAMQGLSAAQKTAGAMGLAGGVSAGEVRGNIYDKISNTSDADLVASSPEYAALRQSGVSEQDAKSRVGASFLKNAPEIAAAGAIGSLGGKYGLEGVVTGAGKSFGRLGNAAIGVIDEGSQGAVEQLASNFGTRRVLPNQSLAEDVAMNAVAEGIMGLGGAAVGKQRQAKPVTDPSAETPPTDPLALPAPTYTGTPSEQTLAAEVERENPVAAAQANADQLYGERDAFEQQRAPAKLPVTGPLSAAVNVGIDAGATSLNSPANPRFDVPAEPRGSFAQQAELARLIEQERADVGDRRELAQLVSQERGDQARRIAEASERRQALEDALADTDQRVAGAAAQESEAARLRLLDSILADVGETSNPARQFGNALRRAGYQSTDFTEREQQTIQRFSDARAALNSPEATTVPAAPNELDPAAMGIRERADEPQAFDAAPRDKVAEVVDLVSQGWKLAIGRKLVSPKGKRRNLNAAEYSAAKEAAARIRNGMEAGNATTQVDAVGDQGRGDVGAGGGGNAQPVRSIVRGRGADAGASVPGMRTPGAVGNAAGTGSALNDLPAIEQVAQEAAQANDAQVAAEQGAAPAVTRTNNTISNTAYSKSEADRVFSSGGGVRAKLNDGSSITLVNLQDDEGYGDVHAYSNDGKRIGMLGYFTTTDYNGGPVEPSVRVDEKYRRKGIASAMYDIAEQTGGLIPDASSRNATRSEDGQAFRLGRDAKNKAPSGALSTAEQSSPVAGNQSAIKKPAPIMRRDDLVGAIMRVTGGTGIASSMAQTITGDKAGRGNPSLRGLFQNAGTMDLDDTAELLRTQEGYDVRDGNQLAELIREQGAGNPVVSMERAEREAAANAEKEYRAAINEQAASMGLKQASGKRTLQMVEADIAHIEAEIEAKERELSEMEARKERAAIQAESVYDEILGADMRESDWMTWLSSGIAGAYTQEEIDNAKRIQADRENARAAANADDAAGVGAQGGVRGRQGTGADEAQPGGTEAGARGATEGFGLTQQTNEQAAEQFAQQQDNEGTEPTKVQADRERDAVPFSLGMQSQPKPQGVQTGLFTADGRASVDVANEPSSVYTAEQRTRRDEYTQDLFGQDLPDTRQPGSGAGRQQLSAGMRNVVAAGVVPGEYATVAEPRKTGEIKSAFAQIGSAGQAAHALAGMRKLPQEHFAVLVLDKGNKPISVLRLFAGATSQTGVYPEVVAKAVYETPGAASIWFAHNHPSGKAEPSNADSMLTEMLSKPFGAGTGIEVAGHIVIAQTRYVEMDSEGYKVGTDSAIPAGARTNTIPVTERIFRKVGTMGMAITSPTMAKREVTRVAGGKTGVVFVNAQSEPTGFLPMSTERMQKLRDYEDRSGAKLLFGAAARSNASSAFIHFGDGVKSADAIRAAENVYRALGGNGIKVLDAFYRDDVMGNGVVSMAERSTLGAAPGRNFESRADRSAIDTAMRRMDRFVAEFERGAMKDSDTQSLGDTPTVLQFLGADNLPLQIDGATVRKVLAGKHKYYVTADMLRQIPAHLYDPLAVFNSPSASGREGKIVVTELSDNVTGRPVIVAVHMSKRAGRLFVNDIASVYEASAATQQKKLSADAIEYVRNKESLEQATTGKLDISLLSVVQSAQDLGRTVATEADVVKSYGARYSMASGVSGAKNPLTARQKLALNVVQKTTDKFRAEYAGAAALDIRVVYSRDEIPARYRPSQYAEGVYHDREGIIYLVAENLPTRQRTWQVLMHETVGHYGLANTMGDQFSGLQQTVIKRATTGQSLSYDPLPGDANYETVEAVRRLYPEANDSEVAQEVLARMAETMPNIGWFRMAMARISQWLKSAAKAFGLTTETTMADVRRMVELAGYHVRSGANLERAPAGQDAVFASQRRGDSEGETSAGMLASEVEKWKSVVSDYLSRNLDRTQTFEVLSETPASMQAIGLPNLPIRIGSHAMDYANVRLTRTQLEDLPRQIAQPQLVYIHDGRDGPSINFVTEYGNASGAVVVAIRPNQSAREKKSGHFVVTILNVKPDRVVGEVRSGNGLYVADRNWNPELADALATAKKQNGRQAREVRELLSRTYGLSSVVGRVVYPSDLVKMIGDGRAMYSIGSGASESRAAVIDRAGTVIDQARAAGRKLAGRQTTDASDPFAAENARLREQDKSLWMKAKTQLRRYLAPGGLLPQSVFSEKIRRDSEFQAVEFDIRHLIGGLERAAKSDFGVAFDKLSDAQMRQISDALAGSVPAGLPESTKVAAIAMRQYIDGMSTEYLKIIQDKIDAKMELAIETGRASDAAKAINDIELFEKIKGNIGRYVHRSYQAFDDPKWFEKVPATVLNASRLYLKQGYLEAGETDAKAAQLAEVTLHEILKNGTAYDSMESFIAESKLGAKDLSVLMRRKEVPAQIRALLGEYSDARLNFTKSATKMGRLIWNTRFLDRVRDIGMGSFFFEGKDRPPAATTQIAADASEVYAPLNGMWTFPEIAQAFKDAMGKEQMSDLYRAIVRANGIVKYGKTVLSPTTAMRNWQSAMFFSLANGHFDLTKMKKSISAFREQVSQKATGDDLKYLRHLKQLGVVYDTPYAGEMARLLEDARMDELLSSDKGDAVRWFRKANGIAQGFYAFGDDFWKIIGFENEKAGLMNAGLALKDAEIEAAKRVRDTYPTYSMIGRGVQWLSRFPLAGTFVSFPAEIVRTSANMLRTVASDLKSDNPKLRELGMRRAAGMAFVSAAFWAMAALSKSMAGVDDDEEEAIRDLAPEWQKNSTFLFMGRDEKGNLRYFDMSFLDPYGYWKRPITAMMRDQPWEESLSSGLRGMLEPFLGTDIAAGAIFEAVSNKKESGGKVYKENDGAIDQAADIADHLRKALQPGFVGNIERLTKAATDVRRSSGQPYSVEDEMVALLGWRATTMEPKTALYYRSFDFTDALSEARKTLTDTLRDANSVSPADIDDAKDRAAEKQARAFVEMQRLIGAAESAGMSKMQIMQTLRLSNISQANIGALMRGVTPPVRITQQMTANAVSMARGMRGDEFAAEVMNRYRMASSN